ncbi:MAG: hypothetical protein QM662_13225 [Gordonia sp. (in: high G+C Gram-positive bacteria)]
MKAADQIESLARETTTALAAASREFTATLRRLAAEVDDHCRTHDEVAGLRADLESAAAAADHPTPRILLPADLADASPHRRRGPDAAS